MNQNMKKIYWLSVAVILLAGCYVFLVLLGSEKADRLTREDGLIENLSAIVWLVSSVILFILYFRSKSGKKPYFLGMKRNIFYLLLALFFFVCFGEEISWGQRELGLKTPEILMKDNAQHEINIHNLWIFQGYDQNNNAKKGLMRWLDSGRIFSLIWFTYCLLIPVMVRYISGIRRLSWRFRFPVVPLWVGFLFLVNYLLAKGFEYFFPGTGNSQSPPIEMKETLSAILYLAASVVLYLEYKRLADNIPESRLQG